jgi:hypothetical protein
MYQVRVRQHRASFAGILLCSFNRFLNLLIVSIDVINIRLNSIKSYKEMGKNIEY